MRRISGPSFSIALLFLTCAGAAQAAPTSADAPSLLGNARNRGKRSHDGFLLRLALGTVYLHESWAPTGAGTGASYSGWGPALETSVGRSLRPGLVVGGRWQLATFLDPNEAYGSASYAVAQTERFMNTAGAFVDDYPNPLRGLHFGGGLGVLVVTDLDSYSETHETSWGAALFGHLGYEIYFSNRWSVGGMAELSAYRYWSNRAAVSAVSDGILPSVVAVFTFQ
jgi:hypothetical protein